MNATSDGFADNVVLRQVNVARLARKLGSEPRYFRREGCREEQCLPCARQPPEHAAKRWEEAHVGHPVGLVQREDLDARQIELRVVPGGACVNSSGGQLIEFPPRAGTLT